uniref:Uncharacterized protein n=1 Tax=Anguilla anguilla TaxID=7936 RepID=A0A0E9XTR4_ANGAN
MNSGTVCGDLSRDTNLIQKISCRHSIHCEISFNKPTVTRCDILTHKTKRNTEVQYVLAQGKRGLEGCFCHSSQRG